jgi:hypothetical protein
VLRTIKLDHFALPPVVTRKAVKASKTSTYSLAWMRLDKLVESNLK